METHVFDIIFIFSLWTLRDYTQAVQGNCILLSKICEQPHFLSFNDLSLKLCVLYNVFSSMVRPGSLWSWNGDSMSQRARDFSLVLSAPTGASVLEVKRPGREGWPDLHTLNKYVGHCTSFVYAFVVIKKYKITTILIFLNVYMYVLCAFTSTAHTFSHLCGKRSIAALCLSCSDDVKRQWQQCWYRLPIQILHPEDVLSHV